MKRADGRNWDELRPVKITPRYLDFADGSALIEMGKTRVLCTASVEDGVPSFLKGQGSGWVTAEYAMLPRSTVTRTPRESLTRISGRTQEIQRLIGRSLRAVVDFKALGERTITVDCDVIQADGGTRTASVTGAYVALYQALQDQVNIGVIPHLPLNSAVAAVSVGVFRNYTLLDLCYDEDSSAEVDCNVVMTSQGKFVEIQGTAEAKPFTRQTLDTLLSIAEKGIQQLFQHQQAALGIKTGST